MQDPLGALPGAHAMRRCLRSGADRNLVAQRSELLYVGPRLPLPVEFAVVVRAQDLEGHAIGQDVVDGHEHRVGHGDIGPLLAAVGADPLELRGEVRVLALHGGVCGVDERGLQQLVALAGLAGLALAGALVVAGDHANNDMAGDEEDSWKSMFAASGAFESVDCQIEGLGRIPDLQAVYVEHTAAVIG